MDAISRIVVILTIFMASGCALAQNSQLPNMEPTAGTASARCAYALTDPECARLNGETSGDPSTPVAQFPRRSRGQLPLPPRPRGVRMANPAPGPVFRGAVIGGMIGFALGAAAPKQGTTGKTRFALGTLVGLAGAGIGAAIATNHCSYRSNSRYTPWPDEDETALRPKQEPRNSATTATVEANSGMNSSSQRTPIPNAASQDE